MKEEDFFRDALSDFTYEAACGGAIRHLTDLGYTVQQIAGRLDFPISYERVRRAVWQRLVDTEVILLEEPGSVRRRKRTAYVREYDRYGKASFRQVSEEDTAAERHSGGAVLHWEEKHLCSEDSASAEELAQVLGRKTSANGRENAYVSCDFGLTGEEHYRRLLETLEERQREYLTGLPWARRRVYHRLDTRMTEILLRLYGMGGYHGKCYFLKTEESVIF